MRHKLRTHYVAPSGPPRSFQRAFSFPTQARRYALRLSGSYPASGTAYGSCTERRHIRPAFKQPATWYSPFHCPTGGPRSIPVCQWNITDIHLRRFILLPSHKLVKWFRFSVSPQSCPHSSGWSGETVMSRHNLAAVPRLRPGLCIMHSAYISRFCTSGHVSFRLFTALLTGYILPIFYNISMH